jgi:hypothetical protein
LALKRVNVNHSLVVPLAVWVESLFLASSTISFFSFSSIFKVMVDRIGIIFDFERIGVSYLSVSATNRPLESGMN